MENISLIDILIAYLLLFVSLIVLYVFKTGLVRATIVAAFRMAIQLALVGLYLEFLFRLNNPWVNVIWLLALIIITSLTIINRSNISLRLFFWPVTISMLVAIVFVDTYFIGLVIRPNNVLNARYLIPLSGIILGNTMKNNIVGLQTFYSDLESNPTLLKFSLANGASLRHALTPYIAKSVQRAFNPTIATMSVIGLVSFHGVMTGQLLSGEDPSVAIKYQLLVMIFVFVTGIISVFGSILLSLRYIFDDRYILKENITNSSLKKDNKPDIKSFYHKLLSKRRP